MDRQRFFTQARSKPFGGHLTADQVFGMNAILDEWERRPPTDVRWLAYELATTFHETDRWMQPVREMGGEAYLRTKPYYPWVGEGLVQVTWEANARKFGAKKPGDCMTWPVALDALFDGMTKGLFTGHRLAAYFSDSVDDPVGARRIINGTDKAELIAGYHRDFLSALTSAHLIAARSYPPPPVPPPRHIDIVAAAAPAPAGFWRRFWTAFTGKAA